MAERERESGRKSNIERKRYKERGRQTQKDRDIARDVTVKKITHKDVGRGCHLISASSTVMTIRSELNVRPFKK